MPIALLLVGGMLLVTAIRGNQNDAARLLKTSFTGSVGFFAWVGLILLLAILGKVLRLPGAFKVLTILVVFAYLLGREQIIGRFTSAFSNVSSPAPATIEAAGSQTDTTPESLKTPVPPPKPPEPPTRTLQ